MFAVRNLWVLITVRDRRQTSVGSQTDSVNVGGKKKASKTKWADGKKTLQQLNV